MVNMDFKKEFLDKIYLNIIMKKNDFKKKINILYL